LEALLHFGGPEGRVAEVLVTFDEPVTAEDGTAYTARACGGPMAGNGWQGWIEFIPASGDPIRSARETTQPNRQDTIYWATGVTPVFLQGSLKRTLNPTVRPIARPIDKPYFDGPAEPFVERALDPSRRSSR
jgi:hypothetical protein